ncbi:MAG TPA: hypothetical protein VH062_04300 [Polyangiaceae bacterium]|jgi:hypothetical protein|nr:hypothetical protein [Polyangiaceae bacterium]
MTARVVACATLALATAFARPSAADEPDTLRADRDESSVTHGMAEFGIGYFTLPGARVCIESQAGCGKGDSSLALSAWPMFRRGNFAAGAGAMLGITSSTDAPNNDPPDVPRDHSRRYLSIEVTARYFIPIREHFEAFVGITTGLGVVNDIFQVQKGLSEYAMVGPRSAVLLTEGFTIGGAIGLHYELGEHWVAGAWGRYSNWFLPETPLRGPFGDEASLRGRITAIDMSLTMAYRSRLIF